MIKDNHLLKNLKIATKLNILLTIIAVVTVFLSGGVLSWILSNNAESVVTDKALVLMETMSAVRNYTTTKINPELADRLETDYQFLPQTVPAFSAREVFEYFREQGGYKDFFYKEATLNPTNLRDKADDFEAKIVEKFRNERELDQVSGFRSFSSGNIFYIARPLEVSKESCLRCHSVPEAAPQSLLTTYGRENGFNWKLHEIVGAQMILVPATSILESAKRLQVSVTVILIGCLGFAIFLINFFLRFSVTNPLKKMAQLAQRISTGDLSQEFVHPYNDEMGMLASSLNRMKVSLDIAMDMLNSETE
ncbi:c-type heme family protein [Crocosphaera sp. Alani8]|uniref:c-type heme family protein n=1 Tax=Crocosphaera sp. Alani8 TaxID=3038952 RepID=UPI00313C1A62